jgi:prophage tail gpP-like protein
MTHATRFLTLCGLSLLACASAWPQASMKTQSVKDIMTTVIAPATTALWGASNVQTDAQWQALEQAAQLVIEAGTQIADGAGSHDAVAVNADWQEYADEMIAAGRSTLAAIQKRDEEALFNAGNDQLYPPCEGCHAQYLPK